MNIQGLTHPKINGDEICLKYHCIKRCDTLCPRARTHTKLGSVLADARAFIKQAKKNYKNSLNRSTDPPNATTNPTPADGNNDQGETKDDSE